MRRFSEDIHDPRNHSVRVVYSESSPRPESTIRQRLLESRSFIDLLEKPEETFQKSECVRNLRFLRVVIFLILTASRIQKRLEFGVIDLIRARECRRHEFFSNREVVKSLQRIPSGREIIESRSLAKPLSEAGILQIPELAKVRVVPRPGPVRQMDHPEVNLSV
ncbi:hypothetical protein J6590_032132 [Homalodisca vitripennis]|nr:hypothetical protein J6590_032130 [Homalodisca vitripennis]KAG8268272.1 hypothetical protein J6590_032132 [Homalodisca vitripennis]